MTGYLWNFWLKSAQKLHGTPHILCIFLPYDAQVIRGLGLRLVRRFGLRMGL